MPTIILSSPDLELLARCFSVICPRVGAWEPSSGDEAAPISVFGTQRAKVALDGATPGSPIEFDQAAWDAFAACCEVGAEMLGVGVAREVTDAQYDRIVFLLRNPQGRSGGSGSEHAGARSNTGREWDPAFRELE